ncbi:MAG TPA: tetratricopeptide repeat protein, partial [Blastocatellia bacterium]|nr:tetratricopeptide repeat protein [Blastocatellia bacterium]
SAGADPGAESLADGVPESVADSLSQLPDLKVIPFFSTLRYKGQEKTPQAIGRELGVRAVVRGKIIERGDDVGISVELVDTRNGGLLWGRQYRRKAPDIFAAPAEIAQGVSEKLRPGLSRETQQRLNKRSTDNAEAYRSYLMGRYYWNKRNPAAIKQAITYFEQAIDRDPVYALAYAGLADSYAVSSSGLPPQERMPRAKSAAMKALDIDETLAEAHASLALVKYRYDWDWPGAEAEFKRAVALNHNYATAHEWYGVYLGQLGRFDQALAELKQAQELEPLSAIILVDTGMIFYSARQYDQALTQCRKALELTPDFGLAHQYIGRAYEQKRMYQEAVDEYLKGRALQRRDGPEIIESLREAYRISGWRGYLRKALDLALAKEQAKKEPGSALTIAELYTRLGEKDSALVWLERAYQERDDRLVALKAGPRFDELRSDPRFADLLRRMGLEQ